VVRSEEASERGGASQECWYDECMTTPGIVEAERKLYVVVSSEEDMMLNRLE
jgi:hypothetical protein